MTHIEKMRLQAALKALPGAQPDRAQRLASHTERSAVRGSYAQRRGERRRRRARSEGGPRVPAGVCC